MTTAEIINLRLKNQRLVDKKMQSTTEIVAWLGAVQSQDFNPAKWAIGQRTQNSSDLSIQKDYDEGKIVRTHVMRPTWHFVSPNNLDWIQKLTSGRVKQLMNHYNKKLELTDSLFEKTNKLLSHWLKNNNYLTRQEIKKLLEKENIKTDVQRLAHIVMWAELEGIICSGPLKERKFTYALLSDRVKKHAQMNREISLRELSKLYFQSHGPALTSDFAWWSGLTMKDAKEGVELNKSLISENVDGKEYLLFPTSHSLQPTNQNVFLLSVYDEYFIAYKDRSLMVDESYKSKIAKVGNALLTSLLAIDGKIVGTWKRKFIKDQTNINVFLFRKLSSTEKELLDIEVDNFSNFFQTKTTLRLEVI